MTDAQLVRLRNALDMGHSHVVTEDVSALIAEYDTVRDNMKNAQAAGTRAMLRKQARGALLREVLDAKFDEAAFADWCERVKAELETP